MIKVKKRVMLSSKSFICIFPFIKVVDSSLEYASLLPVSGNLMPDDELDIATASTLPSLTFQAAASNQAEDYDDQDEFLPSEARQTASIALTSDIYPSLDKHESEESEEDEFAASLMAVAAKGAYKKYMLSSFSFSFLCSTLPICFCFISFSFAVLQSQCEFDVNISFLFNTYYNRVRGLWSF